MSEAWPWLALGLLGAYHGINPSMGWLFAVALGLQERRTKAVVQALFPIALGHEASIALAVLLVGGLGIVAAPDLLKPAGAVVLILFGLYKFLRPRSHPRWVGFRINRRELVVWSFLMSTAHGAGLMLFPVLLGLSIHEHGGEQLPEVAVGPILTGALAVAVHTLAVLVVMGAVALFVYERLGVAFLRRAWINLDLLWAGVVVTTGVFTLFV